MDLNEVKSSIWEFIKELLYWITYVKTLIDLELLAIVNNNYSEVNLEKKNHLFT